MQFRNKKTGEIKTFEAVCINAALVSAQNRKRLFWSNIPNITQPEDQGIMLKDILEDGNTIINPKMQNFKGDTEKSVTLTSTMYKEPPLVLKTKLKTIRSGGRGSGLGDKHEWDSIYQYRRSYWRETKGGKVPTLTANMGTGGNNIAYVVDGNGKNCSVCGVYKGLTDFHEEKGRGYRTECRECRNKTRMKHYKTASGFRLHLQSSATKRKLYFQLPNKEFCEWYEAQEKKCEYCGTSETEYTLLKLSRHNSDRLTIDRIDNGKGYLMENICLCCDTCNLIKGHLLTYQEMKEIGEKYIKPKFRALLGNNVPYVARATVQAHAEQYRDKCPTLSASMGKGGGNKPLLMDEKRAKELKGRYIDGEQRKIGIRKLTVLECTRLQSLPDGYLDADVSNTQKYKALGNAFNCAVIKHILKNIL